MWGQHRRTTEPSELDVNSLPLPKTYVKQRAGERPVRGPRVRSSLRTAFAPDTGTATLERRFAADVPAVLAALQALAPRFGFQVLSVAAHAGTVDFAGPGDPMLQNMRWIAHAAAEDARATRLTLTGRPTGRSIGDLDVGRRRCNELLRAVDQKLTPGRTPAAGDGLARTAELRAQLEEFRRRRAAGQE